MRECRVAYGRERRKSGSAFMKTNKASIKLSHYSQKRKINWINEPHKNIALIDASCGRYANVRLKCLRHTTAIYFVGELLGIRLPNVNNQTLKDITDVNILM